MPTDLVAFELVVFERVGDQVRLAIRGMTTSVDIEAMHFDTDVRSTISVIGAPGRGEVRPFEVTTSIAVEDGRELVVRGLSCSESIIMSDLPELLPLVCGPDPSQTGLRGDFLHRRGGRYVLMSAVSAHAKPGSTPSTMVA